MRDDVAVSKNLLPSYQGFFWVAGFCWVFFSVPSPPAPIPSPRGHMYPDQFVSGKMRPTMTGMQDSCPFLTVLAEVVFKLIYKIVQSGASSE